MIENILESQQKYEKSLKSLDDVAEALCTNLQNITAVSENESDQVAFPPSVLNVDVGPSKIHGQGLFAKQIFKAGDLIAIGRINGMRTPAGRYTNHSSQPNCKMQMDDHDDVALCALTDIKAGEEITCDYFYSVLQTRPQLDVIGHAIAHLGKEIFPQDVDGEGVAFSEPLKMRAKIEAFEGLLKQARGVQTQIKTTHRFSDGLYIREVFMPAGIIATGRIHRHEYFTIMSQGDNTITTENGSRRIRAPFMQVSSPGTKLVGIIHEDSVWTTIHPTRETDIEKLEKDLFTDSFDDLAERTASAPTVITQEGFLCQQ